VFPALGGLLFGYDIGATSGATISVHVSLSLAVPQCLVIAILFGLSISASDHISDAHSHTVASSFFSLLLSVVPLGSASLPCS
jgi:hypothetical protein